jgi:uncharacterized protein with HEPN domain
VKDDRLYVHHLLERCRRITRLIGRGREEFMASEELQDAVIRNVEVIGEAGRHPRRLSPSTGPGPSFARMDKAEPYPTSPA